MWPVQRHATLQYCKFNAPRLLNWLAQPPISTNFRTVLTATSLLSPTRSLFIHLVNRGKQGQVPTNNNTATGPGTHRQQYRDRARYQQTTIPRQFQFYNKAVSQTLYVQQVRTAQKTVTVTQTPAAIRLWVEWRYEVWKGCLWLAE